MPLRYRSLQKNLHALVDALTKAKPAGSKGIYLRKVAVSSTMGIGVRVDAATIAPQACGLSGLTDNRAGFGLSSARRR